jgi:hypothetical protein
MADDTAAEAPLYYIADQDLWLNGPGGNVRAFAAGDHVPPGHVDRFGWLDLVSVPGDDAPGAMVSSAPDDSGPGGDQDDAGEPPAASTPPAAPAAASAPPAARPAAAKPTTPEDGGQPAEGHTTP